MFMIKYGYHFCFMIDIFFVKDVLFVVKRESSFWVLWFYSSIIFSNTLLSSLTAPLSPTLDLTSRCACCNLHYGHKGIRDLSA